MSNRLLEPAVVDRLVSVGDNFQLPAEVAATLPSLAALATTTAMAEASSAYTTNRPVNLYGLGADPTGSTAVNSLLSAHGGRQVDIAPGTYRVSSQIQVQAHTTWNCEPGVKFQSDGFYTANAAMVLVDTDDVVIKGNPVIDGAGSSWHGLKVTGSRFYVNGLTVQNMYQWGVYITGPVNGDVSLNHVRVTGCGRIYNATYGGANPNRSGGICVFGVAKLWINDLYVEGNLAQGAYIASYGGGMYAQLSNITAIGNGWDSGAGVETPAGGQGVDFRYLRGNMTNVIATGNYGQGVIVNPAYAPTGQSMDLTLSNINCYNNKLSSTGGGSEELTVSRCDRLVMTNVKTYNDLASGGTYNGLSLLNVNKALIVGGQFIGNNPESRRNVWIGGSGTSDAHCVDITLVGCQFEQNSTGASSGITGGRVNIAASDIDGLRVIGSDFKNNSNGGVNNVSFGQANRQGVSNTDLQSGNQWDKAPTARIKEYSGITGANRLPPPDGGPVAGGALVPVTTIAKLDQRQSDVTFAILGDSTGLYPTGEWVRDLTVSMGTKWPWAKVATRSYSDDAYVTETVAATGVVSTTGVTDTFTRSAGDLIGSTPDLGGGVWVSTSSGKYTVNGTQAAYVNGSTGTTAQRCPAVAPGKMSTTVNWTLIYDGGGHRGIYNVFSAYINSTNFLWVTIDFGPALTVTFKKSTTAGGTVTLGTNTIASTGITAAIPSQPMLTKIVHVGLDVTYTVGSLVTTFTLTQADSDLFATGSQAGFWATGTVNDHFVNSMTVDLVAPPVTTLTVYNGSVGSTDATYPLSRMAAMLPVAPDLLFINYGHNHTTQTPAVFQAALEALITAVRAVYANVPVVIVSQNPEFGPATNATAHNLREASKRVYADYHGYGYLPAYEKFQAQILPRTYVQADGVHPTKAGTTPDGAALWADTAMKYLSLSSLG